MRIGQKLFRSHSYNPNGSSSMIPEQIRILKSQFLRRANNHNTRISIDKSTILTHFVFLELEWMDDWIIFLNTAKLLRLKKLLKIAKLHFWQPIGSSPVLSSLWPLNERSEDTFELKQISRCIQCVHLISGWGKHFSNWQK